ncbi:MAG: hypothetical protein ACQR33_01245 [Candidatus Saccharibacteria bacterium]
MRFSTRNILRGSDREVYVPQEIAVLHEAENFRRLAALAWSRDTIYPKSEYIAGKSSGQCGVTNFGFGLWLSRLGIADVSQMFFEEGKIVTATGLPVGDDHTWLRINNVDDGYTHPDLSLRFDLAGDQFPGIDVPEVVQYDDYFYAAPNTASGNRIYQADRVTHFSEYDVSRLAGRVSCFMSNIDSLANM